MCKYNLYKFFIFFIGHSDNHFLAKYRYNYYNNGYKLFKGNRRISWQFKNYCVII